MKKPVFYLLLVIALWGCSKETVQPDPAPDPIEKPEPKPVPEEPKITASDLNFSASFNDTFESTLYPSYILGLANSTVNSGKSFNLINFSCITPKNNAILKVVVKQTLVNKETVFQQELSTKGRNNSFYPQINWDYESLLKMEQQGTVDIPITCYIDGIEIDNKNLRINYRSVNDCVFGWYDYNGNFQSTGWMFAAYVNEDNPNIDVLLKEALDLGVVNQFNAYQSNNDQSVFDQIYAIWYLLQTKGIKYSDITNTSNASDKVFSQHVRFFDEVNNNTQANCVDGSVFLCSILEKIGIHSFLVLIPGHMYMGFYLSDDKTNFSLLETTMVGNVDQSEIYQIGDTGYGLGKYLNLNYLSQNTFDGWKSRLYTIDQVKQEISRNSFNRAVNNNIDEYSGYKDKLFDPKEILYQFYDIEELRKYVQPIGR